MIFLLSFNSSFFHLINEKWKPRLASLASWSSLSQHVISRRKRKICLRSKEMSLLSNVMSLLWKKKRKLMKNSSCAFVEWIYNLNLSWSDVTLALMDTTCCLSLSFSQWRVWQLSSFSCLNSCLSQLICCQQPQMTVMLTQWKYNRVCRSIKTRSASLSTAHRHNR